jgi:hypothetical protein
LGDYLDPELTSKLSETARTKARVQQLSDKLIRDWAQEYMDSHLDLMDGFSLDALAPLFRARLMLWSVAGEPIYGARDAWHLVSPQELFKDLPHNKATKQHLKALKTHLENPNRDSSQDSLLSQNNEATGKGGAQP